MTTERIWHLSILKLSGEATQEELDELNQIVKASPEMGFQLEILEQVWKNKPVKERLLIDESFDRHLQRLHNHDVPVKPLAFEAHEESPSLPEPIHIKPRIRRYIIAGSIAASLLFLIQVFFFGSADKQKISAAPKNSVCTKNGSKTKLQLPDGTQVWLNSGSSITYNNDFSGAFRQVNLKGEAFFDVVRDVTRPFIIHTDAIDIKVLGTAFNVRSYQDEKITETSLIRGSVEITLHSNPDKKILLKPNEKLIVKNDNASILPEKNVVAGNKEHLPILTLTEVHPVAKDSATMETLWIKNKLAFNDETLQDVALKLERWFGVHVSIQGEGLKNAEYTGVFEDENLSEVLYALKLTGNFNYTIKKNEVAIKP